MFTLELLHDEDCEMPNSGTDDWRIKHWCNRLIDDEPEDRYLLWSEDNAKWYAANIGLTRKLQVGLAHWLTYIDHGGEGKWIMYTGRDWRDRPDGILVFTGQPGDMGAKDEQGRTDDGQNFLDEYNDWMNGNCWGFVLRDDDDTAVENCFGFIGTQKESGLADTIREALRAHNLTEVKIDGDGAWLAQILDLGVKVAKDVS